MPLTSPETRTPGSVAVAFAFLHLKPSAPIELIDAAVKVLTELERHPRRVLLIHQCGDRARAWAHQKEAA